MMELCRGWSDLTVAEDVQVGFGVGRSDADWRPSWRGWDLRCGRQRSTGRPTLANCNHLLWSVGGRGIRN